MNLPKAIRTAYSLALLFALFPLLSGAQKRSSTQNARRQDYVGDTVCGACHEGEAKTYAGTAHRLASRVPTGHSILGKFSAGSNTLRTSNPYLSYVMTAGKDGYFESAREQVSPSHTILRTERIDLVVGPGRKGQSFLFWKGDELFELPVSYWTELDSWINSPGYPDDSPRFDKPVVARCLECHASSFEQIPGALNRYVKSSLVLGITCEKCHGPGREHVSLHHSKSPSFSSEDASKSIINAATFPRDRQVDACALCHAGAAQAIGPPLSFVPGQPIDTYLDIPASTPNAQADVHGNQVQLLKNSRCYQSTSMTCTTCHDVHKTQRDAAAFSPHCLSCHKPQDCGEYAKKGDQITRDCVDCHMPLQQSQTLVSDSNGKQLKPLVRTHRIAVYPDFGNP